MEQSQASARGPGRPRSTRTPEAVRAAAAELFAAHGFSGTSVRDIAERAGVEPSIVIRHFGSKEALFVETMSIDDGLEGLTEGDLGTLGRRILDRVVNGADPERVAVFRALMRALDRDDVRRHLVDAGEAHIVRPLAARLSGPDARLRAELVAAQVNGLLHALWSMGDPDLLRHGPDRIIEVYGRAMQALIDGDVSRRSG